MVFVPGADAGIPGISDGSHADASQSPPGSAASLAVGFTTACALDKSGVARCWGAGKFVPSVLGEPGAVFSQVAVGVEVCGLRPGGALACFKTGDATPVPHGDQRYRHVSTAGGTCGVTLAGALFCWGGDTTLFRGHPDPWQIGTETDWAQTSVASVHACALKRNGDLYCWGRDFNGAVGAGSDGGTVDVPTRITASRPWVDVSAAVGGEYTCGVQSDGSLWCWGGLGVLIAPSRTPKQIGTSTNWTRVRTVFSHTCALNRDGELWCWGFNGRGALGTGDDVDQVSPARVGNDADWIDVGVGPQFTCALKRSGAVYCWGLGTSGQLAQSVDHTKPTRIDGAWADVSAASTQTCGVQSNGQLLCWGRRAPVTSAAAKSPTPIGQAMDWSSVALGAIVTQDSGHGCARKRDQSVHCFGDNSHGELGTGLTQSTPTAVPSPAGIQAKAVSTGIGHTCAVLADNTLDCWGRASEGQLGFATTGGAPQLTPRRVGTSLWSQVAAGYQATCAIRDDGTLHCFGQGSSNLQPITSDFNHTFVAGYVDAQTTAAFVTIKGGGLYRFHNAGDITQVGSDQNWRAAASSARHTCGIKQDGSLYCFGANNQGQLGDGTTLDRSNPVRVGLDNDWKAIAVGDSHTCGLRGAGELSCWGANDLGQLGDGSAWLLAPALVPLP